MSTYVCDSCGVEFFSGWSDEEAEVEAKQTFGEIPDDDRAVICDDCYKPFLEWARRKGLTVEG